MESFGVRQEKLQKTCPPILSLTGEATDWLAPLKILLKFCQDFIDKRLLRARFGPRYRVRFAQDARGLPDSASVWAPR